MLVTICWSGRVKGFESVTAQVGCTGIGLMGPIRLIGPMSATSETGFIPPHGHYQELLSYQKAEVVYDRTVDQMVQAARSGKQNILEGSKASGTSKEMEVKLTNVARARLQELLADYRDFLRVRDLSIWAKDSKEALYVRKLGSKPHASYESYRGFCKTRPAEIVANIALCFIHQTNYLLDQQIRRLEKDFLKDGGSRERMTRARLRQCKIAPEK